VLDTPHLKPLELFLGVKLTEIFFHLRPRAIKRLLISSDQRYLKIMRSSMWVGIKVVLAEILEFFSQTKFSPQGSMIALPGASANVHVLENFDSELAGRTLQTDQSF
jgi:hypothetical protein